MSHPIIFYPSPLTSTETTDPSKLLSDLGRPTKRGIKKCYKCGVYNGTRGIMCKNKQCDAIFKDYTDKRKTNLVAVKLLTGNFRQVYSVRVRERGPDFRGFVQLPLVQSAEEQILSEVAICFVDSCQRLFDDSILKCHEMEENNTSSVCLHIESALNSTSIAVALEFKHDVLNLLNVNDDVKSKLYSLATENSGPVVQHISKGIMAVRCQVTPKHPLGYLHFTLCASKGKESYDKHCCSCTSSVNSPAKCLHYYACICALASDSRFIREFASFIKLELPLSDLITNDTPTTSYVTESAPEVPLSLSQPSKKLFSRKNAEAQRRKDCMRAVTAQERETSLSFIDWLSFVTEKINTIVQVPKSLELTHHIPLSFFELLKERINDFPSHDSDDFKCFVVEIKTSSGTSCNYTWQIRDQSHLQRIFSTLQVNFQSYRTHNNLTGEREEFLCLIEWSPNILPVTRFGELRLKFQFEDIND